LFNEQNGFEIIFLPIARNEGVEIEIKEKRKKLILFSV